VKTNREHVSKKTGHEGYGVLNAPNSGAPVCWLDSIPYTKYLYSPGRIERTVGSANRAVKQTANNCAFFVQS
jgi:hypothetical protein